VGGCKKNEYQKYETEFIGSFDVRTIIVGYSKSESEFTKQSEVIYNMMEKNNQLFDIYHDYEGVVNIKTINDNAGIKPVEVSQEIIDLLLFSQEAYEKTDGLTNVAMGAVLKIWHEHRTAGIAAPAEASLPNQEELIEAAAHTNIDDMIIDQENHTVYLQDPQMSLDVGAVAKGFTVAAARDAAAAAGMDSAIINAGGNVMTIGAPQDGVRERWGIGIQDPDKSVEGTTNVLDTVFVNDKAVVSSGSYERYYVVDEKTYHHIIDPDTLYPSENYKAISVIHESSAVGDYLSTALFIASYEAGLEIAAAHNAEVLWVTADGEIKATKGYQEVSKKFSNYSADDD
jgi:thiamine biosynthesis lipoprotein